MGIARLAVALGLALSTVISFVPATSAHAPDRPTFGLNDVLEFAGDVGEGADDPDTTCDVEDNRWDVGVNADVGAFAQVCGSVVDADHCAVSARGEVHGRLPLVYEWGIDLITEESGDAELGPLVRSDDETDVIHGSETARASATIKNLNAGTNTGARASWTCPS